jgi:hypothetical protein
VRVASNSELVERMSQMNIDFVAVDLTIKTDPLWAELLRTGSDNLPTNLIYPPNYPDEPAIKLDPLISPAQIHKVLDRMEEIQKMAN